MNLGQKIQANREQLPLDVLFALLAFILWLLTFSTAAESLGLIGEITLAVSGIVCCFAFAFRSEFPNTSTIVIYSTLLVRYLLFPTALLPADLCLILALYYVSVHGTPPARIASFIGALIGGALLSLPFFISELSLNSVVYLLLGETLIVITVTFGSLKRLRNEQRATLQKHELAHARDEIRNADLAVAAERTRIAREMHDIVAHTLSVVIAQADGGKYAAQTNPQAAAVALETISEMSRAALKDIRSIIGVLRDPTDNAKQLQPQPIDNDIETLVAKIKESGTPISYIRIGQPQALPVGLGNALFRICQESLTNALKHAGPNASIAVILSWEGTHISLKVIDDGRGAATRNDGQGHGIIGMRERAALFGGTIEAGARAEGGFRVKALIPIGKAANKQLSQAAAEQERI
ncbi:sensor histidine kinase [Arcanobacterium hippocoleae]